MERFFPQKTGSFCFVWISIMISCYDVRIIDIIPLSNTSCIAIVLETVIFENSFAFSRKL